MMETDQGKVVTCLPNSPPTLPLSRMLTFCLVLWLSLSVDVRPVMAKGAKGSNLSVSTQEMLLEVGEVKTFWLESQIELGADAVVFLTSSYENAATVEPMVIIPEGNITRVRVNVTSVKVGSCEILMNTTSRELGNLSGVFVKVQIHHSNTLSILIIVVGWIYFAAWSISFYPQAILNYQRKSVVGLNFDFLGYNITGFIAYATFNIGLYWIEPVMDEYQDRHPYSVNPVLLNDVAFSLHAVVLCSLTIVQALIYEKGGQRVTIVCRGILTLSWTFIIICLIITVASDETILNWLDFLYMFSYVKLAVTLIKYMPQAYMNYTRKSTEGWSIGNVLLDFTGGAFSLIQMFLLAYNNDDWAAIFGDPTKFGLGVFSIAFDILFIIQHYALYRDQSGGKVDVVDQRYPEIDEKASLINHKTGNQSNFNSSTGSAEFSGVHGSL